MKRDTKSTKQKDLKKILKSFQCIILKRKILQESPLFVLAMKWAGPPSGKGYRSAFEMSTMGG